MFVSGVQSIDTIIVIHKISDSILLLHQVCMLNTRLAAAESMTHDVIRDLLGVKLDMTNYAVSFMLS